MERKSSEGIVCGMYAFSRNSSTSQLGSGYRDGDCLHRVNLQATGKVSHSYVLLYLLGSVQEVPHGSLFLLYRGRTKTFVNESISSFAVRASRSYAMTLSARPFDIGLLIRPGPLLQHARLECLCVELHAPTGREA